VADEDTIVEAAALIFEARLTIEAVSMGLERLMTGEGASLSSELCALKKMNDQAAEALEALQTALGLGGPVGHG
jgi:hypothetical protein